MKKAKRSLMALLMTAAMTISAVPVTAYSQIELEPIEYVDENNISHTLVTKYTDDMEITQLIEKTGEISPVSGLKAEYAGVFKGMLEDKLPFSFTNDFVSLEDDTIYMTDMLIYNAKDEKGNKGACRSPGGLLLFLRARDGGRYGCGGRAGAGDVHFRYVPPDQRQGQGARRKAR